jgi:hypothetical protein
MTGEKTAMDRVAECLWVAIAIATVGLYGHFGPDDFFITYRYAANLAAGDGFVFNPGERVFGVTEPAQVVLLAGLHAVTRLPLPILGAIVTALALVGLSIAMARRARLDGRPERGWITGTLILAQTLAWASRGAGVVPGLALLAGAAANVRRPVLAGTLSGLAAWFRPELAIGALFLAPVIARCARREGGRAGGWLSPQFLRYAGTVAGIGAAGALLCWTYFGRLTPSTLLAKQHFANWNPAARSSGLHFLSGAGEMLANAWGPAWFVLLILGGIGGLLIARRGSVEEQTIVVVGAALAVVYPILGVPLFTWYVIPTEIALVVGYARLSSELWRGSLRRIDRVGGGPRGRGLLAGGVGILLLAPALPGVARMAQALGNPGTSAQFEAYREAGLWLGANSPPDAEIAALEVGTLAYYSDRRVVDLLGLVTPAAIERVRDRTVIDGLREAPSDFFVLTQALEGLTGPVRSEPWFLQTYDLVQTFSGDGGQPVWVFRRRSGGLPLRAA